MLMREYGVSFAGVPHPGRRNAAAYLAAHRADAPQRERVGLAGGNRAAERVTSPRQAEGHEVVARRPSERVHLLRARRRQGRPALATGPRRHRREGGFGRRSGAAAGSAAPQGGSSGAERTAARAWPIVPALVARLGPSLA